MNQARSLLIASSLILAASLACRRDQVESTRIEKAPSAAPTAQTSLPPNHPPIDPSQTALPPNHPPIDPSQMAPPAGGAPAPNGPVLTWTLPKGWTEEAGSGMRFATLKPAAAGNVEVSVVSLSGPAGGELANVNRWRGQLGLPPIDEAALGKARRTVKSKAGSVSVFEFANAGSRMIVGLLATADGSTWFVKLVGEDAPAGRIKPEFMQLIGTLSLG